MLRLIGAVIVTLLAMKGAGMFAREQQELLRRASEHDRDCVLARVD